ncbi:MAG: pentapeptide repeat-containing protein [Firmicutes bacterium]|nr:pentapeptide repeat-containing protein [Bacillota bacterium]
MKRDNKFIAWWRKELTKPSSNGLLGVVAGFLLAGLVLYAIIIVALKLVGGSSVTLYDIFLPAATVLGVITVGGAAVVQFRKQYFTEVSAELDRDTKYTELLTKAIEHLGNESIAIRTGALYELKRLAQDSEKDRENVLEIINRFVIEEWKKLTNPREDFSFDKDFPSDIVIAKTIIALLLRTERINHTELILESVHLEWEHLRVAHLCKAHLSRAHFEHANLSGANLKGAHLLEANLGEANLIDTCLIGADLRWAINLTADQLMDAIIDETTLLDPPLRDELIKRGKLKPSAETANT